MPGRALTATYSWAEGPVRSAVLKSAGATPSRASVVKLPLQCGPGNAETGSDAKERRAQRQGCLGCRHAPSGSESTEFVWRNHVLAGAGRGGAGRLAPPRRPHS